MNQGFDWDEIDRHNVRVNRLANWIIFIVSVLIVIGVVFLRISTAHADSGRPSQCPHRYCGCSLSIEIFGRADPKLFPAAAWLRFPRARPAPGMVAVRSHHVMRLVRHVKGREWLTFDPNSGGGLTREHVRNISGFVVVNPQARI